MTVNGTAAGLDAATAEGDTAGDDAVLAGTGVDGTAAEGDTVTAAGLGAATAEGDTAGDDADTVVAGTGVDGTTAEGNTVTAAGLGAVTAEGDTAGDDADTVVTGTGVDGTTAGGDTVGDEAAGRGDPVDGVAWRCTGAIVAVEVTMARAEVTGADPAVPGDTAVAGWQMVDHGAGGPKGIGQVCSIPEEVGGSPGLWGYASGQRLNRVRSANVPSFGHGGNSLG